MLSDSTMQPNCCCDGSACRLNSFPKPKWHESLSLRHHAPMHLKSNTVKLLYTSKVTPSMGEAVLYIKLALTSQEIIPPVCMLFLAEAGILGRDSNRMSRQYVRSLVLLC